MGIGSPSENSLFGANCRVGTLIRHSGLCDFRRPLLVAFQRPHRSAVLCQQLCVHLSVCCLHRDPPPSNVCVGPTVGDYSQITVSACYSWRESRPPLPDQRRECRWQRCGRLSKLLSSPQNNQSTSRKSNRGQPAFPHYPWPPSFDKRVPWQHIGFENWIRTQDKYKP